MALKDMQFLSLEGLRLVVTNITDLINDAKAASKINAFTNSPDADKTVISLQQGGTPQTVNINSASTSTAGLLSAADKRRLNGIQDGAQVNVIEGIVVRAEGDTDTAVEMTTITADKKLVIDNIAAIATTEPTEAAAKAKDAKLAPTAKAVRTYVDSVKSSLGGDISGLEDRISETETVLDNLGKAVDAEINARAAADNAITGDLDKVETFLGTLSASNSKAANVYNKTEVDTAITTAVNAAKKEILTGEAAETLGTTYDTLLEISKWIGTHGTEAANLAESVATNAQGITDLKDTLGTGFSTASGQTVADKIASVESNINNEITRATNAEAILTANLTAEVTRATNAEATLTANLTAETTARADADTALQTNINNLTNTVSANKTAIEGVVNALAYVKDITAATVDGGGNILLNYSVNNGTPTPTPGTASIGSIIQESDINKLFGKTEQQNN